MSAPNTYNGDTDLEHDFMVININKRSDYIKQTKFATDFVLEK